MHTKIKTRRDYRLHQKIAVEDAKALRTNRPHCAYVVTIGNVDLPAFVSDGKLYIQAPLPHLFKAFAEDFSEFLSDLEVGVSTAGSGPLSLDRNGYPVSGPPVAKQRVVRGRGK